MLLPAQALRASSPELLGQSRSPADSIRAGKIIRTFSGSLEEVSGIHGSGQSVRLDGVKSLMHAGSWLQMLRAKLAGPGDTVQMGQVCHQTPFIRCIGLQSFNRGRRMFCHPHLPFIRLGNVLAASTCALAVTSQQAKGVRDMHMSDSFLSARVFTGLCMRGQQRFSERSCGSICRYA